MQTDQPKFISLFTEDKYTEYYITREDKERDEGGDHHLIFSGKYSAISSS